MADTTDDSTTGSGRTMKEVSASIQKAGMVDEYPNKSAPPEDKKPAEKSEVSGAGPHKLTPEEMNQNPADILEPDETDAQELLPQLPEEIDNGKWDKAKENTKKQLSEGHPGFWKAVQKAYLDGSP